MNSALYAAYQGMRARQQALDTTANNIANASTAGFKADRLLYSSVETAIGAASTKEADDTAPNTGAKVAGQTARAFGVSVGGATEFTIGPIRETGRALDVALEGEGFFVVQTARGERYTRAGSFTLDAAGQLVNARGDLIAGERGPITLPPGPVSIGSDGTISVANQVVDRLRVVRFNAPQRELQKEGDALFVAAEGARPGAEFSARVTQGALEMSNVNAVAEMAAMMQHGSEFDLLQRSITMAGDLGRKAAGEIGKI